MGSHHLPDFAIIFRNCLSQINTNADGEPAARRPRVENDGAGAVVSVLFYFIGLHMF